MIPTLYEPFRHWSDGGSVYILSDLHFDDEDCKSMSPDWITPEEQLSVINGIVMKNDTFICLGDVGSSEYIKDIKARKKILILGNHDAKGAYNNYFDEIYTGPLFIAEKILLSHEPVYGLSDSEGYQAIIDNKAYSRYSITGDHRNRMIHNYIGNVSSFSEFTQPIGFFSYIAGGFANQIDKQIRGIMNETGVHGSAMTVRGLFSSTNKVIIVLFGIGEPRFFYAGDRGRKPNFGRGGSCFFVY